MLRKEFDARVQGRPQRWEIRASVDVQRRRHQLRKLTAGDFTSIRKPTALDSNQTKTHLEPVLQYWMPQFNTGRIPTTEKTEEHRANLVRQKQVKAAVQRQRWVSMMNSDSTTGLDSSQIKNMAKIQSKSGPAIGQLSGLLQTQNANSGPPSLAKQQLLQIGAMKKKVTR